MYAKSKQDWTRYTSDRQKVYVHIFRPLAKQQDQSKTLEEVALTGAYSLYTFVVLEFEKKA